MENQNISEVKARIKEFCFQEGLSIREFEAKANLYNGFFIHVKSISNKALRKIFNAFPHLDQNWLLYGKLSCPRQVIKFDNPTNEQIIELPQSFMQANDTLKITDNSMAPYYIAGDLLALKSLEDNFMIINGKEYVFEIEGLGKILRKGIDENTQIKLSACDGNFSDMTIPKEKITRCYNVVGLIRNNL